MPSTPDSRSTRESTQKHAPNQTGTEITRSGWILWLVGFYAILVLFSWAMICLLDQRPVTTTSYQKYPSTKGISRSTWNLWSSSQPMRAKYDQNERWYKAIQVLQSIVGVLTIPVTSAVCSSAVVVYLQCRTDGSKPKITLRQLMVLADKGWTDISTYLRISTQWTRYGTPFLAWALALHFVGAIISPLQQVFLSTEVVKTPTNITAIGQLLDIPNKFENGFLPKLSIIPMTQKLLASTSAKDVPSQLWAREIACDLTHSDLCSQIGPNWADLSISPEIFWAQLPSNYSTGLIRQYLPRFNSSARYDYVSEREFPRGCDSEHGTLSLKHNHTLSNSAGTKNQALEFWALHACMPGNQLSTPWKNTRDRQDFGEALYLNITMSTHSKDGLLAEDKSTPTSIYARVIVNTTAGYFELPNYMNGQTAGSLLEKFPYDKCDAYCDVQEVTGPYKAKKKKREQEDLIPAQTDKIEEVLNKGPLLTTTLALFGRYSWLETANRFDTLYGFRNASHDDLKIVADLVPMGRIIRGLQAPASHNEEPNRDSSHTGINDGVLSQESDFLGDKNVYHESDMFSNILTWLVNFRPRKISTDEKDLSSEEVMANAFNIASYLANIAWITDTQQMNGSPTLSVLYDKGANSRKPSISLAGIVVVSVLILFHLIGLFLTALYASWFPRWTTALDAFSLLRLGGSIGEHVPLKISRSDDQVKVLDELPGWVGCAAGGSQSRKIGSVELGGPGPLRMGSICGTYEGSALRARKPQSETKNGMLPKVSV